MYANAALLSKLIGFKHFYPSKIIHVTLSHKINLFFLKYFIVTLFLIFLTCA